MRTHDHSDLILLEELVNNVGSIAHDIVLLRWVSHYVHLHTKDFITGGRVTPHDIHAHLLDSVLDIA